jgi:hypothetical protein
LSLGLRPSREIDYSPRDDHLIPLSRVDKHNVEWLRKISQRLSVILHHDRLKWPGISYFIFPKQLLISFHTTMVARPLARRVDRAQADGAMRGEVALKPSADPAP